MRRGWEELIGVGISFEELGGDEKRLGGVCRIGSS